MIRYVEHDAEGNIFHVCVAEFPDEPVPFVETDEAKAEREDRNAKRIAKLHGEARANLQKALVDAKKRPGQAGRGMIMLDDADELPHPDTHKVDPTSKKVRPLTQTEKDARRNATPPGPPTP